MLKIRRQRVEMESESWVLAESEDELKEKERTNGGRTVSQQREREVMMKVEFISATCKCRYCDQFL